MLRADRNGWGCLAAVLLLAGCPTTSDSSRGGSDSGGFTGGVGDTAPPVDVVTNDVAPPIDIAAPEDVEAPTDTGADVTGAEDPGPAPIDNGPADTGGGGPILPEPNGVPSFGNCSEPGGERNIYDLQDPQCPDHITPEPTTNPGVQVAIANVVVTAVFGDTTFVQEEAGGPYSGIAVFTHGIPTGDLAPGHQVNVVGSYSEYFGTSQIHLESFEILGETDVPQPFVVSHPAHVETGGTMAEMMEGVFIRVNDVQTIHTKPDCPNDYGEFMVTGELRVDNMGFTFDARLGDQFASIVGPLHYTFGNTKIEPRTPDDLDITKTGGASSISKCIEADCFIPETVSGTGQVIVNEVMPDPYGPDTGQEWIELYNPTGVEVDLDGWQVRDCGGQAYTLVGANLTIGAGKYLVLGMNATPATNGGVPVDYAYGEGFYLPNTVGAVILMNGSDPFQADVVDQMRYSRFEPWDVFFAGHSLERKDPLNDGTKPESWATGSASFGTAENQGTPGAKNSAQ